MTFPDKDNSLPLTALSTDELHEIMREQFPDEQLVPAAQSQPTKRKIVVAILSYDAKIFCRTMMSLMSSVIACGKEGWEFAYLLREGDSMVARGRSFLASQFLTNPELADGTDLVFIDCDLAFSPDDFIRLCKHPVDVVAGAYPYKDDNPNYPLRWPPEGLMETNGLWEVEAATPGFMRITRRALEKIAMRKPWLEFKDRANGEGHRSFMFFDNMARPNGVYDEGYVFCEHWRSCGGTVYLDPSFDITHIGNKAYRHGSLRQWLDKKAATFTKLEHEFPNIPPLKLMGAIMENKVEELKREVDDQHSVERPAGVIGGNGQANPAEHQAAGNGADDIPGFGRSAVSGGDEIPLPSANGGLHWSAGGFQGSQIRPRAETGAG